MVPILAPPLMMIVMMLTVCCRPGSDLNVFPAQLLHPPSSHSSVLRKTHSHPHSATAKSPTPAASTSATKVDGKRQSSPPSAAEYHPRAQSIPSGSGTISSGDAAVVAARADRLKADENKSRSKSGSPRQVDYCWSEHPKNSKFRSTLWLSIGL